MDALLDKIDKEITTAAAEAQKAEDEYLSASDPQQGEKWQNIWRQRLGKERELREQRNAIVMQSIGAPSSSAFRCSISIAHPSV